MKQYRRPTGKKLWILRILLALLLGAMFYAYRQQLDNLFYFLIVVTAIIGIAVVTTLSISSSQFVIRKYYFFGLIPITYRFNKKDKIFYFFYEGDDPFLVDIGYLDQDHEAVGCVYFLFSIFYKPNSVKRKIEFRKTLPNGSSSSPIDVFLDSTETGVLKRFLGK